MTSDPSSAIIERQWTLYLQHTSDQYEKQRSTPASPPAPSPAGQRKAASRRHDSAPDCGTSTSTTYNDLKAHSGQGQNPDPSSNHPHTRRARLSPCCPGPRPKDGGASGRRALRRRGRSGGQPGPPEPPRHPPLRGSLLPSSESGQRKLPLRGRSSIRSLPGWSFPPPLENLFVPEAETSVGHQVGRGAVVPGVAGPPARSVATCGRREW